MVAGCASITMARNRDDERRLVFWGRQRSGVRSARRTWLVHIVLTKPNNAIIVLLLAQGRVDWPLAEIRSAPVAEQTRHARLSVFDGGSN